MNEYRCETCNHKDNVWCELLNRILYFNERDFISEVGCASHSDFQSERGDCIWMEDEDGIYHTSCGESFEFMNGTPDDNHMKFCPYCGKLLRLKVGEP